MAHLPGAERRVSLFPLLPRAARSAGYDAERDFRNTETIQFAAMLALVIDALSYVLQLLSTRSEPAGIIELAAFAVILAVSVSAFMMATMALREGRSMPSIAIAAFWFVVVAAGSAGWTAALSDLRGFVSYAAALLGTAVLYRSPWKLALGLFLGAAVLNAGHILVHLDAGRAEPLVAYALLYSLVAFVISLRLEKDHLRLFQAREELAAKNAALEELSLRDPLTQLFNRRYFMEVLSHELRLATRERRTFGVGMIDLDNFKRINDELGHAAGDLVLKDLALVLLGVLRGSDIVARYGGEEFLVILAGCDLEHARLAAERVRRAVELRAFAGVPWQVTVSMGVTAIRDTDTEELLLKRADMLLYRAKDSGRNRVFGE
jgi:diguanylate cyclase (GGDEF)-like protein